MSRILNNSWWLLALCGVLDCILSLTFLLILNGDLRTFLSPRSISPGLGMVALAAGISVLAAGLWNGTRANSWLLVLHGVATGMLGLLFILGTNRPVAFRTIAFLVAAMAVSIGVYELANARAGQRLRIREWLLAAAGLLSLGFAVVFLGFGLRWIELRPASPAQSFSWLISYFAFSGMCMLGLSMRGFRPPAIRTIPDPALPTT